MEKVIDIASEIYKRLEGRDIYAFETVWKSDDIKKLIQYDVLKVCSLVYLFSDVKERQIIEEGLKRLFGNERPKVCFASILTKINIRSIFNDLFINLPISVAVAYSDKSKKDSETGFLLATLETIILAIVAPDCRLAVDIRVALISTFFECCENKLKSQGIVCDDKIYVHLDKLADYIGACKSPSEYNNIEYVDNRILEKIFDKFKNTIDDGTLTSLIENSVGKEPTIVLTSKKIRAISDFIDKINNYIEIDDGLLVAHLTSLKASLTSYIDINNDNNINENLDSDLNVDIENKSSEKFNQKKYNNPFELKFDEAVLPEKYTHFGDTEVNEYNFDALFQGLKAIETRYEKGLPDIKDDASSSYTRINDWESECCYEQSRFIENVVWTGNAVQYEGMEYSYPTIRKFDKKQLKYYLYWRTNLFKGTILKSGYSHLFLCMNELLAGIGVFSKKERVRLLERLVKADQNDNEQYEKYRYFSKKCKSAIRDYEKIFNLINLDKLFTGDVTTWTHEWDYCAIEIINKNYTHLFEAMNRQSGYHPYSGALCTKIPCDKYIIECIKYCAPYIDVLLVENGFSLSEVIVGQVNSFEQMKIEEAAIWTDRVQKRLYGNENSEAIVSAYSQEVYPLSDYYFRVVENVFRKFFGIGEVLKTPHPIFFDEHYAYIKNKLTQEERIKRDNYLALFVQIDDVLAIHTKEYVENNMVALMDLKNRYANPSSTVSPSTPLVPFAKKVPADELMIETINNSDNSKNVLEKLIEIYNGVSPSAKKSKSKKFASMMWDYWILHKNDLSYEQLAELVQFNNWNIIGIKALQSREFAEALVYLRTFYDPCSGVVSKTINNNVIADGIIMSFLCIDRICSSKGIDFIELLLGRFGTYNWEIYNADERLNNNMTNSVVKNIGGVQIYQFDTNISTVKRHSYDQNAKDFTIYLLKSIDNHFREQIGYKSLLNIDYDISKHENTMVTKDVLLTINQVLSAVVKFVIEYNRPKYKEVVIEHKVEITNIPDRNYVFVPCEKNNDISVMIREEIEKYYGTVENIKIKANKSNDLFVIDLDNFDIHDWLYCYENRESIKQLQFIKLLHHSWHREDELIDIKNIIVEYNPDFDFSTSRVGKNVNGFFKDQRTFYDLNIDATDFLQWIEWVKRGKFVYTKNKPYVQILFQFILNDWVLNDNRLSCLVMICEIWNYYFGDTQRLSDAANLYLEWIKDYWMIYCRNEITYDEFKSLFVYDIEFHNNNGRMNAVNHFFIDMEKFDELNLLQFYNDNCDYHVLEGKVVKSGYKILLEKALEEVHASLKKLWAKYNANFIDFLHKEEENPVNKTREVFYQASLTNTIKKNIVRLADEIIVSETEKYVCDYDYDKAWPVFKYQVNEVSNASSRLLLEYILKLTEKGVREWLDIPYSFKFDEKKLFEAFPNRLFLDNMKGFIIEATIMDTVLRVCINSGIKSKNPKIVDAQIMTAVALEASSEGKSASEFEHYAQNLGLIKEAAKSRHSEYDLIEREQAVDKESIEMARAVLKKNQERLVIDEEIDELLVQKKVEGSGLFDDNEKELLRVLLDGDNVREKIHEFESRFISVGLLIESINNKAIDEIGDIIIEEAEGPHLVEDYLEEVKKLFGK